jgi:hypothetical protein
MIMPVRIQTEGSLTGEMRVRVQRFTGKLILQVEVNIDVVHGLKREYNVSKRWRDAKPGDVGLDFASIIKRAQAPTPEGERLLS